MNRQRVYRAGLLTPCTDTAAVHSTVTAAADAARPHPTARSGALFASPTLAGVVRWVLGNHMCGYDTRVHELSVDADTTYVYLVRAWERVSEDNPATITGYWETGMTLTDWLAADLDAAEWEVIVDPDAVLRTRNVSAARLLAHAPTWRVPELKRIVRGWARTAA